MNNKITYHKVGDYHLPNLYLTKDEYEKIILQLNKSIAFYDTQIDLIDQIIENQKSNDER